MHAPRWLTATVATAAGLTALGTYLATIAPGITTARGSADSGELVAVASVLGVAHAPGYGLYLLLARAALESLRFLHEPALRTNVLSALCTALAIALTYLLIVRWRATPPWAALIGALVVATASIVWSQAIVTEVYALQLLLTIATLLATLHVLDAPFHAPRGLAASGAHTPRWALLGLTLGLGAATHPTGWMVGGCLGLGVLVARRPSWAALGAGAAAFALPLLAAFAYLLIRADAPLAWGDADTLAGAWRHANGSSYRALWEWSPRAFAGAFPGSVRTALAQVPPPLWPLLPWGALAAWRARPELTTALLAACTALLVLVTVYRADGREPYLDAVVLAAGLCAACGLGALRDAAHDAFARRWDADGARDARAAIAALALLAGVMLIGWGVWQGQALSMRGDDTALRTALATLDAAPRDAVLMPSRDEETFPLWYARIVLGIRPDVTVRDARGLAPVVGRE